MRFRKDNALMRNPDPFEELLRSLEENLRRGERTPELESADEPPGEPPPPPRRPPGGSPARRFSWRSLWWLVLLAILFFGGRIVGFLADWTWFESVGYGAVFWTRIWARLLLFLAGALFFFAFYVANIVLARRLAPWGLNGTPVADLAAGFGVRVMPLLLIFGALAALFLGLVVSGSWEVVLRSMNSTNFGATDPLFGRDVGFFVFALPVQEALRTWLLYTLVLTLAAVVVVTGAGWRGWRVDRGAALHIAVLAALILLLWAWQHRLASYALVYSARSVAYGAGYTDANLLLPAYTIMIGLTALTAVAGVVLTALRRSLRPFAVLAGLWFVVSLIVLSGVPSLYQSFIVRPNELTREAPYIERTIENTRRAYDLDGVEVVNYPASQPITAAGLLAEPESLRNIRLWDYRPLLQTYNQVQALRLYYAFNDIDIDRYALDGTRRQVMLSARELVPERLAESAQTWVNRKLVYTHGFGVAASPVAQVTRDGLPEFYLKDLPVQGVIDITTPQIYFGELTNEYVVGRTRVPEFDYPAGDGNVTTQFAADTGIDMSWWNRLLFAIHLGDYNLLLNGDLQPDSQLLWRRNIVDRVQRVAPFLQFDRDPYIVIGDDGRLYWMQDAYTTSRRYPYSAPLGNLNYMRNTVKVVTDTYDGTMTFYVTDTAEPLIAAYSAIFPTLFRPLAEMPDFLLDNIRYPEDLFTVQAEVYRTYHMTDPREYYNKEDVWAWPEEIFDDQTVPLEPYFVLMQLPGSDELAYVTILPYTPSNRENMVAWLAVHSDPDQYGRKVLYNFGKDSLQFGPKQVEARINQDPTISAQLTLWNQQGSGVIRGNMLVMPIADSLLYVEPVYLQAASGRIPELQRVIVATANDVVMAENLGLALVRLFGRDLLTDEVLVELGATASAASAGAESPGQQQGALPVTLEELIVEANAVYERGQERLREGDLAGYADEMAVLQSLLEQLAAASGVALPSAAETPATDAGVDPLETPAP